MPGVHSEVNPYRYWVHPGADGLDPLHTPAGTRTWTPTVRSTVRTRPNVGDDRRASTYTPTVAAAATPTSSSSPHRADLGPQPCRVSVRFSWTHGRSDVNPDSKNADSPVKPTDRARQSVTSLARRIRRSTRSGHRERSDGGVGHGRQGAAPFSRRTVCGSVRRVGRTRGQPRRTRSRCRHRPSGRGSSPAAAGGRSRRRRSRRRGPPRR